MSNAPNIRFKGFTEPWEQRKLGDFTSVLSASRVHKDEWESDGIPFFRSSDVVSAFKGIDNERAYISQELYEKLIKSSGKLEEGDILITGGGSIGIPYIVPNNAPLYTKDADLIWIKKSLNHNSKYLYTYFTGMQFRDYISSISHVGTIAHYTIEQVKNTPVLMPNMDEQKAIGDFLSHIDYLIILHQRKYNAMSELKKYMLQKMFPKNGEQFPEIRFSGYTDPWEQCKLSELSTSFEYGLNAAAKEYDGENKYIRITDINDVSHEFMMDDVTSPDIDLTNADAYKLSEGDILFARTGASVGKTYIYKASDGLVYYAGFLIRARIKDEINSEFVFQNTLTKDYEKYIAITSQRSGQPGINAQEYSEYRIMVPDRAEQDKISAYLRNIDTLITLHQRKCDELKEFKKYMLQNMFPQKG